MTNSDKLNAASVVAFFLTLALAFVAAFMGWV
jgi:hypothetical protein